MMTLSRAAKEVGVLCSQYVRMQHKYRSAKCHNDAEWGARVGLWWQPSYDEDFQHFCYWWQQGVMSFFFWGRIVSEADCFLAERDGSPTSRRLWRWKEMLWFLQQPGGRSGTAMYNLLPMCRRLTSQGMLTATDRCKLFCLLSKLVVCKAAESYADMVAWRWALDSLPCLTAEIIT